MKKKLICLLALILAFAGKAAAWDAKITETHWFSIYEYEDYDGP